jgi:enamine deaminase RidA (YjgF/YER057c/UK114 family)
MSIERVPGAGAASFSKAVVVNGPGRTVYVSGTISPGGSMAEQANGCIDQIEEALRAVGGSLEHVVRITAWLTRLDEYGEYNRVRGERFGADLPCERGCPGRGPAPRGPHRDRRDCLCPGVTAGLDRLLRP